MLCTCFRDSFIFGFFFFMFWARGSTVCSGCALQVGQSRGSIPDRVIETFRWHNRPGRTTALRSTQPLAEMSTRNFPEVKLGRYVRLTTLPPLCVDCFEMWKTPPPGTLLAWISLKRDCFTIMFMFILKLICKFIYIYIYTLHASHVALPNSIY